MKTTHGMVCVLAVPLALCLAVETRAGMGATPGATSAHHSVAALGLVASRSVTAPGLVASRSKALPAPLPAGYTLYRSKVLPYSIGYPRGWTADGSIWGSVHNPDYYDEDTFTLRHGGDVGVWGEALPRGSTLTSQCYAEMEMLEEFRSEESSTARGDKLQVTITRQGTLTVDGRQAFLFDELRGPNGVETLRAVWVEGGRGWKAGATTLPGQLHRLLPAFKTMLHTFHMR